MKLKELCRTRWVERHDGLDTVVDLLLPAADALTEIKSNDKRTEVIAEANGLLLAIVVKSNCGSSFPGAGFFCTYPISLLLKQSCDNNIVNCVQMIYTEVLCCLEHHFKAYTRIKNKTLYRKLIIFIFSFYIATSTPPPQL